MNRKYYEELAKAWEDADYFISKYGYDLDQDFVYFVIDRKYVVAERARKFYRCFSEEFQVGRMENPWFYVAAWFMNRRCGDRAAARPVYPD